MNQKFFKSIKNIMYTMFDTYFKQTKTNHLFFEYGSENLIVTKEIDSQNSFLYTIKFNYNNHIVELAKYNNFIVLKNGYISDLNDIFYLILLLYRSDNEIIKQIFELQKDEVDNSNLVPLETWKKYILENLSHICDNYNVCQNINVCWQCFRVLSAFNIWIRENFLEKFLDEYGSIFIDVLLHEIPQIKKKCDKDMIPEILYINIFQFSNGNSLYNIEVQFSDLDTNYNKEFYENVPEKFIIDLAEIEDIKEKFQYIKNNLKKYMKNQN